MSGWPSKLATKSPLYVGALVAACLVPGALWLGYVASLAPFGRDQGIFHYVGWAILQGEVLYRDVRDVNGPLTAFVHAAFIGLGASEETSFRALELAVGAVIAALVGSTLPEAARGAAADQAPPSLGVRAVWALAALGALGAQYLSYDYWHSAQRETFCGWFVLLALASALHAHSVSARPGSTSGAATTFFVLAGLCSVVPVFGKPTYATVFVVLALATLADGELRQGRLRAFAALAAGAALGSAAMLALLASFGDVGAFVRVSLHDVPAMYRFIWPRPLAWYFVDGVRKGEIWLGLAVSALGLGLVLTRRLPPRLLAVVLLPLGAIAGVVAQRKGFDYHHHPISAAVRVALLAFGAAASWHAARIPTPRALAGAAAIAIALLSVGLRDLRWSPTRAHTSLALGAPGTPAVGTESYFARYPEPDFFPWELRRAAEFVRAQTRPGDRVQMYGMDPYLLYLAERGSATPYIYAYDLSPGAALAGGVDLRPSEAQRATILAIRQRHEDDLYARITASPPAAFVLVDLSPTMSYADALADLDMYSPRIAAWLVEGYDEAARFGTFRVYLPRERQDHQSKAAATPR